MQTLIAGQEGVGQLNRERAWPLDARMAMFVLEAGGPEPVLLRERAASRQICRIIGTLCEDDPRSLRQTVVYIRDIDEHNLGYICQRELSVGQTVWFNSTSADGEPIRTACRVGRANRFMDGWSEGVLHIDPLYEPEEHSQTDHDELSGDASPADVEHAACPH